MYQGTKMAFKNALFLDFLQSAKTSNLRALLTRSGNALLGNIFTFLCFNFDTKHTCKRPFNWPSLISARVMWICLSFRLNFCGRSAKTAILLIAGFRWTKNSRVSFRLTLKKVYQKVSPGKIWRNPRFEFGKSIPDIYIPLVLTWKIIILHFHLQPKFKYQLFHIYFTSFHSSREIWTQ